MKARESRLARTLLALLFLSGLLAAQGSAYFFPPVLNEAPLTLAGEPQAASAAVDGPYHGFLPVITNGQAKVIDDRQAVVDLWINEYMASDGVANGWTGSYDSCSPGDTSQAFKDAVVRRINYYRSMAGVPGISGLNAEYSRYAQAAALLMSRSGDLSHNPPADWPCYSGDAYTGASHSNIALGMYGPGAINGYIQDYGAGNAAAGHRRWVLNPYIKEMGSGDVPGSGQYWSSNALYVVGVPSWPTRPVVRDDYVAWPPKGYVPYQVVFRRWTFSYPGADFSNTQVSVTRAGANQSLTVNTPHNGYGENTVVWEMSDIHEYSGIPRPDSDTHYLVTVSNVLVGGAARNFSYEVIVIDPDS